MPDPITWYLLGRTATDLESIMEAIDAKLLTHNQDPSAHGQSGEVVEVHRVDPDLDHLDGSINLKKLSRDKLLVLTAFESLDGWLNVGSWTAGMLTAELKTTNVLNNEAFAYWQSLTGAPPDLLLNYSKNPFFQTTIRFKRDTNQLAYIVAGFYEGAGDTDNFGFKIQDAAVYAYWTKGGAANTQIIGGVTITDINVYRAVVRTDDSEIDFYVNGTLKYTATANFPTDVNEYFFCYYLKTEDTVIKYLYPYDLFWMQDR